MCSRAWGRDLPEAPVGGGNTSHSFTQGDPQLYPAVDSRVAGGGEAAYEIHQTPPPNGHLLLICSPRGTFFYSPKGSSPTTSCPAPLFCGESNWVLPWLPLFRARMGGVLTGCRCMEGGFPRAVKQGRDNIALVFHWRPSQSVGVRVVFHVGDPPGTPGPFLTPNAKLITPLTPFLHNLAHVGWNESGLRTHRVGGGGGGGWGGGEGAFCCPLAYFSVFTSPCKLPGNLVPLQILSRS